MGFETYIDGDILLENSYNFKMIPVLLGLLLTLSGNLNCALPLRARLVARGRSSCSCLKAVVPRAHDLVKTLLIVKFIYASFVNIHQRNIRII